MKIVLDASMALSWHLKRVEAVEAQCAKEALLEVEEYGAVVPPLWYPEVANGLLVAERRGVSSQADVAAFLSDLLTLEIATDPVPSPSSLSHVLSLGRVFRLTGYDATYLELAKRGGARLATFDDRLANAARAAGVQVFGDPV